jgi:hypothetical protein
MAANPGGTLRALLVSYVFPPTGGAGVGRVLKLAKYLPAHGVVPAVLTVKNPSVPLVDTSLEKEIAPDLEILRARTLEPGYKVKQAAWTTSSSSAPTEVSGWKSQLRGRLMALGKQAMIPDPQVLWQPDAQRVLVQRLLAGKDDVVFITAPPFSSFLMAPLVRLRPGTAVVLDYRDEWQTLRTSYEMIAGRITAGIGALMETTLLRTAAAVTTATEAFRQQLLDRFSFLSPDRVVAIPNGYDPADFPAQLPAPPTDRLVVTYAGTIFKLTSAQGLIGAVRKLHARAPALAKLLEVRFVGRIVDTELPWFEGTERLGIVRVGYVDKDRVIPMLSASHIALCLLDDVAGVERIYPAKIFELMYLGRPCLTLSPPGALTQLVESQRMGAVFAPRDEEAIATFLEAQLCAFRDGALSIKSAAVDIERFDRRAQAGEFAAVFRQAVADARGGPPAR